MISHVGNLRTIIFVNITNKKDRGLTKHRLQTRGEIMVLKINNPKSIVCHPEGWNGRISKEHPMSVSVLPNPVINFKVQLRRKDCNNFIHATFCAVILDNFIIRITRLSVNYLS